MAIKINSKKPLGEVQAELNEKENSSNEITELLNNIIIALAINNINIDNLMTNNISIEGDDN